jgi:hypothetical protein
VSVSDENRAETPRRAEARRQRRGAHQQLAERQRRQTLLIRVGIAVAIVAVVAIAAFVIRSLQPAAPAVVGEIQTYENLSRQHTSNPVSYAQQPPVGGAHDPVWQNCGYYGSPVRTENAVHALEHGAIWITYSPDLPQEQIDTLRNLAESQTYILVSPMDNLPSPVVASAWGKQILLDSADDERLADFIRRFRLDPNGPEVGAPCTGGTSETA